MIQKEVLALLMLAFIGMNIVANHIYTRSYRRIQFRQPPLSKRLLVSLAVAGGALGALWAMVRFRRVLIQPLSKQVALLLGALQVLILAILILDTLSRQVPTLS
jgi:uncharacterized membrane protein YsdA (DUF1294 family)